MKVVKHQGDLVAGTRPARKRSGHMDVVSMDASTVVWIRPAWTLSGHMDVACMDAIWSYGYDQHGRNRHGCYLNRMDVNWLHGRDRHGRSSGRMDVTSMDAIFLRMDIVEEAK